MKRKSAPAPSRIFVFETGFGFLVSWSFIGSSVPGGRARERAAAADGNDVTRAASLQPRPAPLACTTEGVWLMEKLLVIVGTTAGGWIGWALGERVGMTTAFILGTIGSGIGLYVGRRIVRDYF